MEVGIYMAKYSYEFKKKIVMEYVSNKGSLQDLATKYGIKSSRNILTWVKSYEKLGDEGIIRSRKKEKYTYEFKVSVVELYLTTEVSYQELALSVGIKNPSMITRWVIDFRTSGPEALREKTKGRQTMMNKPKNISKVNVEKDSEQTDYLKKLEDENLKLRIELAYLKESRRLRLEQEALNKKRELSVASEENSN